MRARTCSVPDGLPISQRLPIEISRLIPLHFDSAGTSLKPDLASEFRGAADVKCLPLAMLCHADHVPDYFRCGQPGDQSIFRDFEGQILATFVGIEARFPAMPVSSGLI